MIEKIEKMLSFLYKNNQEILNICFSRTMKEKSISEERMGYFLWMLQNGRSRK